MIYTFDTLSHDFQTYIVGITFPPDNIPHANLEYVPHLVVYKNNIFFVVLRNMSNNNIFLSP